MLQAGATLRHFLVVKPLGSGGFGTTYLVVDQALGKFFAIKEYCPLELALSDGAKIQAKPSELENFLRGKVRFIEEARTLARFNHPNIIGVSQIFEENGTAYIVMDYQSGRSLRSWLKEIEKRPSQEELDIIIEPLLNALEVMHRNSFLHRDISPDNIYIREDGSPVLLGFGLARDAVATSKRTISTVVTTGFSPPELYSTRASGLGPWTDIYAFSATLYLSVTGRTPPGSTDRLMDDLIIPASQACAGFFREPFLHAIDAGLRLVPRERHQSVAEWRTTLIKDRTQVQKKKHSATKISRTFEQDQTARPHKSWIRFSFLLVVYLASPLSITWLFYVPRAQLTQPTIAERGGLPEPRVAKREDSLRANSAPTVAPPITRPGPLDDGGFAVQLGAPDSDSEAKAMIAHIQQRFAGELGNYKPIISRASVDNREFHRVRIVGLSQSEAAVLCERLKTAGGSCFLARDFQNIANAQPGTIPNGPRREGAIPLAGSLASPTTGAQPSNLPTAGLATNSFFPEPWRAPTVAVRPNGTFVTDASSAGQTAPTYAPAQTTTGTVHPHVAILNRVRAADVRIVHSGTGMGWTPARLDRSNFQLMTSPESIESAPLSSAQVSIIPPTGLNERSIVGELIFAEAAGNLLVSVMRPGPTVTAQRAAMLVQATASDQQNVHTHVGSASWRIEESRRPRGAGLPALRADIDLPGVGLRLMFLIEKNNDTTLRASHMLTFRFLPQEGSRLPPVAEIGSPQMRNEAAPAVEPLAGASAKITDQIYIVALTADPTLTTRNLELIRSRGWFDLPLRLSDGRIAKITLEKGQLGERLLTQALDAWQR